MKAADTIYDRATQPTYRPMSEYEAAEEKLGGNVCIDMFRQEADRQAAVDYYNMRLRQIRGAKKRREQQ